MEPFVIKVPEDELDDLQHRLERTRWVQDFGNDDWRYGANTSYLRELVDYWRRDYDWRAREAEMNRYPHFRTTIENVPVHFLHIAGKGPNPKPLILNHGWPWTFWDYRKLLGPLSDPAAFGGDSKDAFTLIVPSLPGFGFSTPLVETGMNWARTADLWVKLMRDVLGYDRFASVGGDYGAFVTAQLGHKYVSQMIGCYVHLMAPLDMYEGGSIPLEDFGPGEEHWPAINEAFWKDEAGYYVLQATKPQTPAIGLNDSPAGLLAWLVEKRRTWSHSEGDVERRFTKDDLIDNAMIYWITQSYGTSARYYYEAVHQPWRPSHNRMPVVEAPTGLGLFTHDVVPRPRRWLERYYNVKQLRVHESGGHFAAMEEPDTLISDIRDFFKML